jgi:nucleoid-associated protein YgaU
MGRYENTRLRDSVVRRGNKDVNTYEIKSFSSTVYGSIPLRDGDIHVITQPGDRFDLLAHQFYGDVNLWWYIAKANGFTFMTIPIGSKIRIPADSRYAIGK